MLSSRLPLLASLCLFSATILTTPLAQSATFTFAPLNDPAGFNTEARGINASGEIAGFYQTDTSCNETTFDVLYLPACPKHGFTYLKGKYQTFNFPGATSTMINGLNDLGDLVGVYIKSDGSIHGFLRLHTGSLKTLDDPNGNGTIPMGVNKSLVVVGQEGGMSFRWSNGKFTLVGVQSGPGCANCNGSSGIANNGMIAGFAFKYDFWVGYLVNGGDVDYFGHFNNGDSFTDAVNDNSDIVGYGGDKAYFAPGVEQGETSSAGEKEKSVDHIVFTYPGSGFTQPYGINDSRAIVGAYGDNSGVHGFLAMYQ